MHLNNDVINNRATVTACVLNNKVLVVDYWQVTCANLTTHWHVTLFSSDKEDGLITCSLAFLKLQQ